MRFRALFGSTLCVFLALTMLFVAAAVALHHWGGRWARAAYEPILAERVAAACARQRHGEAERILLQALHSSPDYAHSVQNLAGSDINVMPELRRALAETPMPDAPLPPFLYFAGVRNVEELSPYRRALAEIAQGRSEEGRALLEDPSIEPRALGDAAFRLGQFREGVGDTTGALLCYGRALTLADAHLGAAQAYVRLARGATAMP